MGIEDNVKQVERQVAQRVAGFGYEAEGFFKKYYWIGWVSALAGLVSSIIVAVL